MFLARFYRYNRQNLNNLWQTDGSEVEFFTLTMSIQSSLRFDDKSTRAERQQLDNLARICELFKALVEKYQNMYSMGENCTLDEILVAFNGR